MLEKIFLQQCQIDEYTVIARKTLAAAIDKKYTTLATIFLSKILIFNFPVLFFFLFQDETRKKAASTYLVENTDIPPPRYQKDGTLPSLMPNNTANSGKNYNTTNS